MTTRISDQTREAIRQAWPSILEALAGGALVRKARAPFSDAEIRCYRETEPGARAQWQDAREDSGAAFMDEALEIARDPFVELTEGEDGKTVLDKHGNPLLIRLDAQHARTRIDTLKWAARVRNPRDYSDRAQLDVNVKTVDLTRIISEANARLAAGRAPRILEHEGAKPDALPAPVVHAAIAGQVSRLLELM